MSRVSSLHHIVFTTKDREATIPLPHRKDLFMCILSECKRMKCTLIRINCVENHIHLLVDVNPTICLSEVIRSIKSKSSYLLHRDERFPLFKGWGSEYFAGSISEHEKDGVIEYIKAQEAHHAAKPLYDEMVELSKIHGISLYTPDWV